MVGAGEFIVFLVMWYVTLPLNQHANVEEYYKVDEACEKVKEHFPFSIMFARQFSGNWVRVKCKSNFGKGWKIELDKIYKCNSCHRIYEGKSGHCPRCETLTIKDGRLN